MAASGRFLPVILVIAMVSDWLLYAKAVFQNSLVDKVILLLQPAASVPGQAIKRAGATERSTI